jgi:hypothetical protein
MDGYSVKDAALVLGVPERRVWELIARGVLASAPEGPDGMRVFLQPRTPPASPPQPEPHIYRPDEPEPAARTNGNGGSHEMSPFRELLTEFRSLTERYGQALLALGEARGEVASLRTRVDLLEARMDLRLPTSRPSSTVAWEIPGYEEERPVPRPAPQDDEAPPAESIASEPDADEPDADEPMADEPMANEPMAEEMAVSEPTMAEPTEPDVQAVEPEPSAAVDEVATEPSSGRKRRAESRRRKIRGGRSAFAGLADALARADDPTLSELPGAQEAADALAALQRDLRAEQPAEAPADELPVDEIQPIVAAAGVTDVDDEAAHADGEGASATAETTVIEVDLLEDQVLGAAAPAVELPEADMTDEAPAGPEADEREAALTEADMAEPEPEAGAAVTYADVPEAPAAALVGDVEVASDPDAASSLEVIADEQPVPEAESEAAPLEEPEPPSEQTQQLVAEPEQPVARAVPSIYSSEVIEPDWFADGDFTWLDAAQAEAQQAEAQQAEAAPAEQASAEAPRSEASDGEASPAEVAQRVEAPFEPTAHDEVRAEEEARAALQDAFETPATTDEPVMEEALEAAPTGEDVAEEEAIAAIQDAFAAPAPAEAAGFDQASESQSSDEASAEEAQAAIQDAFQEPPASAEPYPEFSLPEPTIEGDDRSAVMVEETPVAEAAAADVPPTNEVPAEDVAEIAAETSVEDGAAAAPAQAPAEGPAGEEELMWLGDEFEEAGLEVATQGWRSADAPPPPPSQPRAGQSAPMQAIELSDAELAQLAADEGWDADEVEAIRNLLGRSTAASAEPTTPASQPVSPPRPTTFSSHTATSPAPPPAAGPAARRNPMASMSDPRWLKGRRGPAATAYRRLRRLFPS